jgi:exonuclease III
MDIVLMQETGVNWSVIPRKHQWMERSKQYFEPNTSKISFGFNRHDKTKSPRQWGGTGIFTRGKLIHFSMGTGTDEKGLGRWTWARYRGRQGIVLRVVSIYQPCNSRGPASVHEQQRCHLQQNHDDRPVRLAFCEDFADALASWLQAGDQIIVGGDVNDSVFHQSILDIFQAHAMHNVNFNMHPSPTPKKTYFMSNEHRVVDCLWATPGIQVT